jgi:hypothetical protein
VTLGLANRLLKHTIDYADLVVERTSEVLIAARILQIGAAHKYATIKQEISHWGICNGPTLANLHLAPQYLDEQIGFEGELTQEEREVAILDAVSLKLENATFKKELSVLKKQKTELSQQNTAAKVEVTRVERETGRYSKPIWQGLERILERDWNIKRPSWHGGDILGNKCRKLMACLRLIFYQIKDLLVGSARREWGIGQS